MNKAYYIATILQYSRELSDDGFTTEIRKVFSFEGQDLALDLYAQRNDERRAYKFCLPGEDEAEGPDSKAVFEELCKAHELTPFILDVPLPPKKQIQFDELENIVGDYFLSGDLLPELAQLPCLADTKSVSLKDISEVIFERDHFLLSAKALIYVDFKLNDPAMGETHLSTECFPLNFTTKLDGNYNFISMEYSIDLSGLEAKNLICQREDIEKIYVSKEKFDSLTLLYQELSENFLEMIEGFLQLSDYMEEGFDEESEDSRQELESLLAQAESKLAKSGKSMRRNAPFVPQKLFDILGAADSECGKKLALAQTLLKGGQAAHLESDGMGKIIDLRDDFIGYMRSYLTGIDIG
ncbi:MAG: hypothetical protein GX345_04020 [Clostridiales bacterium]|nr:hypothetical protein [Clostridiales bacterium]